MARIFNRRGSCIETNPSLAQAAEGSEAVYVGKAPHVATPVPLSSNISILCEQQVEEQSVPLNVLMEAVYVPAR